MHMWLYWVLLGVCCEYCLVLNAGTVYATQNIFIIRVLYLGLKAEIEYKAKGGIEKVKYLA